ncbi:MAG: nucleotidyltransferase family protein [Nitrospiraceae bacterium]
MPQIVISTRNPSPHTTDHLFRFNLSHLTIEAQLLVLLARTSANGTLQVEIQDRLRDGVDWSVLWSLAESHGAASLVYRMLLAHGGDSVPKDVVQTFRRKAQTNAIVNGLLRDELVTLAETFAAKGIRMIPFKGPTLAIAAYGDLTLREAGDVDLIVEQSCITQARQLLWSQGYQFAGKAPSGCDGRDEAVHSFLRRSRSFRINLQLAMSRGLFSFPLDREPFWTQLKPVRLGPHTIMALAPEELLIVLCVSGSMHAWENLKWICDVSELLRRRRTLDWSRVLFLSHALRCRRMLLMGLALAHTLFDAPLPRVVQHAIMADRDVPDLTKAMPRDLLKRRAEGIDGKDAEALCLLLKDSWIEQSKYALAICHAADPIVNQSLPWFRLQARLNRLYRLVHPFHRAAARCLQCFRVGKLLLKWPLAPG